MKSEQRMAPARGWSSSGRNYDLRICWLYPDLMSTYGDRGNVIVLQKRSKWRGITASIDYHTVGSPTAQVEKADILFMGGAQDRQQELVSKDIGGKKAEIIRKKIEEGTPGLFICGAYQFLGSYYKAADGTTIPGLGIFDVHTIHPGKEVKRAIGNIVIDWNGTRMAGFENHGGRTYLGKNTKTFARVIKGYGNNGEDDSEGAVYKNAIGTYLHGPVLPKNPELADLLIAQALQVKYGKEVTLVPLDDELEHAVRTAMLQRLKFPVNTNVYLGIIFLSS